MELIYYWINEDNCIHEQGFNFSPEYNIVLSKDETGLYHLELFKTDCINVFSSNVISNITAVVGENGAGKSTLLKNLMRLNCFPMEKITKGNYEQLNIQENSQNKNIIILRNNGRLTLYTNIYRKDIIMPKYFEEGVNAFFVSDSDDNISGKNILNNNAYCGFTKLYISNSFFDGVNVAGSQGNLDHMFITPAYLSFVSDAFFEFIAFDNHKSLQIENNFYKYSIWLKKNKYPGEFQQVCDILFYNFLIESNFIDEYKGFVQTEIIIKFSSIYSIYQDAKNRGKHPEEISACNDIFDKIGKIYVKELAQDDPIYVLKANLIFEWELWRGTDEYGTDIDTTYNNIAEIIKREEDLYSESLYFREAIKEIEEVSRIIENIPLVSNVVPNTDLTYQSGKKTRKCSIKQVNDAKDWKQLISYIDSLVRDNSGIGKDKKQYGSFILRYLSLDNLMCSSGERVFQNMMSWMFFLSKCNEYVVKKECQLRKDILVCFDEMDLSLHPAWQRDIVGYIVKLVNNCYKGKNVQIIFTTHSPLCLSNVPKGNIIYLKKSDEGTSVDTNEHKETFGSNIYELLNDAFYLENNSVGNFAKEYIQNVFNEIKILKLINAEIFRVYKKRINCIGDSLIKNKLETMLINILVANKGTEDAVNIIDNEIKRLQDRKHDLLKERGNDSTKI